jgi:hypothetical protein
LFKDLKKTLWKDRYLPYAHNILVSTQLAFCSGRRNAALDCGCKTVIPMHWGTWIMSYEHILTPIQRLQYAWDQLRPENMGLRILKMGETIFLMKLPVWIVMKNKPMVKQEL